MKMKRFSLKLMCLVLAVLLISALVPGFASAEDPAPQVRVIVENTTCPKGGDIPWDGTLVDKWVTIMKRIIQELSSYEVFDFIAPRGM